jgi:hypothetical protein
MMTMANRVTSGAEHIYESSSKEGSMNNEVILNDLANKHYTNPKSIVINPIERDNSNTIESISSDDDDQYNSADLDGD